MKVLVTGGAGYIGSHVVRALQRLNMEVVVLDSLELGHKAAVQGTNLVVGNLADKDLLSLLFADGRFDAVMHFAAYSQVGESMLFPERYYHNNVAGTLNLLEAMLQHNVKKLVFSSTAAVYGEPAETTITEDFPAIPANVYGKTKLMIETMLKDYDRAYGLKFMSLRYFNAAGADLSGDIGEDHIPETHLIPLAIQAALGQRNSIKVFGADYDTPDGTCIRDYIHVNDLADAHVLALQALVSGADSSIYNLGTGRGYSVLEIIDRIKKASGVSFLVEFSERRKGDPAILVADSNKINKELGFNLKYSDLDTIIKTAWKWHSNYPKGYRK